MNYAQLKLELKERGHDLNAIRRGRYINRAYDRLNMMHTWPYRESSGEGTSPLVVADLGQIEAVTNETLDYELEESSYQDLLTWFGDLAVAGSPTHWYRAYVDGDPVVATYPTNGDTIGVQFWRVLPALSANTDVPEVPTRWHGLIVDVACQMAYRDKGDHQSAEALQQDIDRQTTAMVEDMLPQQSARHQRTSFDASCDW